MHFVPNIKEIVGHLQWKIHMLLCFVLFLLFLYTLCSQPPFKITKWHSVALTLCSNALWNCVPEGPGVCRHSIFCNYHSFFGFRSRICPWHISYKIICKTHSVWTLWEMWCKISAPLTISTGAPPVLCPKPAPLLPVHPRLCGEVCQWHVCQRQACQWHGSDLPDHWWQQDGL